MKATACCITGCLFVWLTLPMTASWAAWCPVSSGLSVGSLAVSQVTPRDPKADRQEAERLLREARQAMNRGELEMAERFIGQAERLNVTYDPLYERFIDTPAKARRTLNEMRAGRTGNPMRPSERFSPLPTNPPVSAPPSQPATAAHRGPQYVEPQLDLMTDDARSRARMLLEKGRLSLQQGDLAGAVAWWQQAAGTGARFAPGEYSPDSFALELQRVGVPADRLIPAAPAVPARLSPNDLPLAGGRDLPLPASSPNTGLQNSAFRQTLVETPYDVSPTRDPLTGAGQRPGPDGRMPPSYAAGPAPGEPRRLPTLPGAVEQGKTEALRLLALSRATLDRGDAIGALRLAEQARDLRIPDNQFQPNEPRPEHLLLEIHSVLKRQTAGTPGAVVQAYDPGLPSREPYPVRQSLYDPARETSRIVPAQATAPVPEVLGNSPTPANPIAGSPPNPASQGVVLYQQGIQALEKQDRTTALQLFSEAWKYEAELDPGTRQSLRDKLTLLRVATPTPGALAPGGVLEEVDSQQRLLRDKLLRDITREQAAAEKMRATDPRGSLARLQRLREQIEQETLDPVARRQLLTVVDRSIREAEGYIETNLADIEMKERNTAASEEIDRTRQEKLDTQNELARLVEQFNDLIEEERFAEAELIAKQAHELDPEAQVVRNMFHTARFAARVQEQEAIRDKKEEGFYGAMTDVEVASAAMTDDKPLLYGDAKQWIHLSTTRLNQLKEQTSRLTPAEQEIQKALKTEVDVSFQNRPLGEVMQTLGRMAGVNVYLDPQGLTAEGVTTDEPITLDLTQPISLRSALNLILEPLHLSYVIQNEVLRVTSEQTRNSNTYSKVYPVGDLVIPIPNFIPSYNVGLPGAIQEAIKATGQLGTLGQTQTVPMTLAANDARGASVTNPSVLASYSSSGMLPGVTSRTPQPFNYAPGSMGGATQADFDTLIDLITSTIAPQSWDTVGGPGSIEGFPTNLSLVISQTQEVHEQIADLLDQLRRLQDLQVTIEVRFITISDDFFERIGVDFDFEVDDNTSQIAGQTPILPDDTGPSTAFGLDPTGLPTLDYDYAVTQGSFGSAVPAFGGFDASTAANFGFAILSDIEVFFLLQAAQGDDRTNVLQAPKVTLFNGQTGFVSDTSQRPFVTSVIPVVGDFAAAHQPVVVVLNEGTSLSVQAVVSPDRRFVRLTMVPFFSSIGAVDTFTFTGRVTSDSGTVAADPTNETDNVTNNAQQTREGTTVQLPTFNFTTVSTTVSVPDGGTVLLGGIKRLSEGRTERGVPMLNKIPYISRLFKNVGIGREAESLMMMVTPRIIIQEEEELQQTGHDSSLE